MNKPTIWLERIRLRAFCITFRQYFYSILCGGNLLSNFFMRTLLSKPGIDYLLFRTNEDIVAHNENAVNSDFPAVPSLSKCLSGMIPPLPRMRAIRYSSVYQIRGDR